jgi:hypothetical protein
MDAAYIPPPARDTSGKYARETRCHCCGQPVRGEYCSDSAVLDHSNNPCDHGLVICERKRCDKRTDGMNADERLALYCRQIEENKKAESENRKAASVKVAA